MSKNFITVFFLLLFCLSATAKAQTNQIVCSLNLNDRMLNVKIEIPANNLDKTSFSVSDWAGQKNYADNVYRVSAKDKNGNALVLENPDTRTWIVNNAKKAFEINYTVVSQKDSFMGNNSHNHFHPTLFKDYVFLWGPTFLLFPDAEEIANSIPVKLQITPNEYTNYYTNFEGKADSFNDLNDLLITAGNYRVVPKNIGGRNVKFLLQGKNWKFTDEQFTETVSHIIESQTKYMGFSPSKEDLLITLTEGTPNSKGGTAVKNVISVYPNPQVGLQDFETLKLIAHEHFHFWNGNYWHEAKGKKEGYYKWMSEGFTEYYAGLTLFRENLITEKQFVAWLNELLQQYQVNPNSRTATAEILSEKYWESNDYNRLPYVKGALIGFLTDLQIRQKTNNLKQIDDLMKLLMSKTNLKTGYDDNILLANYDTVSQSSNKLFYDDFMLGAKLLPIVEVLKASGITASEVPREVFDLGFTTESGKLERGAKIKEVTSQSAISAGFKVDDELTGFSFRNGQINEQASFTVLRGSETLQIKYYAKKNLGILQIDENAKIPR